MHKTAHSFTKIRQKLANGVTRYPPSGPSQRVPHGPGNPLRARSVGRSLDEEPETIGFEVVEAVQRPMGVMTYHQDHPPYIMVVVPKAQCEDLFSMRDLRPSILKSWRLFSVPMAEVSLHLALSVHTKTKLAVEEFVRSMDARQRTMGQGD